MNTPLNTALLRNVTDDQIYDSIQVHKHRVEHAFEKLDRGFQIGVTTANVAAEAFDIGFQLHEYLSERQGLPVVPDCPHNDWYVAPIPSGWWDTASPLERDRFINEFEDRVVRNLDPEDTALD